MSCSSGESVCGLKFGCVSLRGVSLCFGFALFAFDFGLFAFALQGLVVLLFALPCFDVFAPRFAVVFGFASLIGRPKIATKNPGTAIAKQSSCGPCDA